MAPSTKALRLTFLGCGHIGKALLGAVLPSIAQSGSLVSSITVALNRKESQLQLERHFHHSPFPVTFVAQRNVEAVANSDAVLFAFPPDRIHDVLNTAAMRQALKNKLIISLLARTPRDELDPLIRGSHQIGDRPAIARAMPTVGAQIHESATLIANPDVPEDKDAVELASWIFGSLGRVFRVSNDYFDTATGMTAISNAVISVAVNAIVQRAVAHGVPAEHAIGIVAQSIRGTASILLAGTGPGDLQASLSAPGSITGQAISGLTDSQFLGSLSNSFDIAIQRANNYHKD